MKAQRFTVALKPTGNRHAAEFTAEEVEAILRNALPNVLNEKFGTHTLTVKVAR